MYLPAKESCFLSIHGVSVIFPGGLQVVALLVQVLDPLKIMPEMTGSLSLPGNCQCPNTVSSHVRGILPSAISSNAASSSGVGGPTREIHLPTLSGPRTQVQLTSDLDKKVIPRRDRENAKVWSGWTTLMSDLVCSGSATSGCIVGRCVICSRHTSDLGSPDERAPVWSA